MIETKGTRCPPFAQFCNLFAPTEAPGRVASLTELVLEVAAPHLSGSVINTHTCIANIKTFRNIGNIGRLFKGLGLLATKKREKDNIQMALDLTALSVGMVAATSVNLLLFLHNKNMIVLSAEWANTFSSISKP